MRNADKALTLTPANMHAAFDPNGTEVWCHFAEREAMTNDGFCQYCGSTEHRPYADVQADWLDRVRDDEGAYELPVRTGEDEIVYADES